MLGGGLIEMIKSEIYYVSYVFFLLGMLYNVFSSRLAQ